MCILSSLCDLYVLCPNQVILYASNACFFLCLLSNSHAAASQKALAGELYLAGCLSRRESALGNADALAVRQLKLLLLTRPGTGAVVGEVDAGKRVGTEVVFAVGYRIRQILLL